MLYENECFSLGCRNWLTWYRSVIIIKMEEILGAFKLIRVHQFIWKRNVLFLRKIQGCLSC